jgi:hypothetical protein
MPGDECFFVEIVKAAASRKNGETCTAKENRNHADES